MCTNDPPHVRDARLARGSYLRQTRDPPASWARIMRVTREAGPVWAYLFWVGFMVCSGFVHGLFRCSGLVLGLFTPRAIEGGRKNRGA